MSRLPLAVACLRGKPVSQQASSIIVGLQQLCIWPAEPSQRRIVDLHTTAPAVGQDSQQTSRTELGDSAATSPTVKHGQPSMMPKWSERRQAIPVISGYRTAAVLEPIGSAPLIVISFDLKLCLNNQPSRLTGNEGFRQQLLRRRGKLVLLTPPKPGAGVQEVAEYLKPMLTVAAGGSLDAYRI
ncbi:hypothetical protein WJX82_000460 [Trebouxia sp. C0006]